MKSLILVLVAFALLFLSLQVSAATLTEAMQSCTTQLNTDKANNPTYYAGSFCKDVGTDPTAPTLGYVKECQDPQFGSGCDFNSNYLRRFQYTNSCQAGTAVVAMPQSNYLLADGQKICSASGCEETFLSDSTGMQSCLGTPGAADAKCFNKGTYTQTGKPCDKNHPSNTNDGPEPPTIVGDGSECKDGVCFKSPNSWCDKNGMCVQASSPVSGGANPGNDHINDPSKPPGAHPPPDGCQAGDNSALCVGQPNVPTPPPPPAGPDNNCVRSPTTVAWGDGSRGAIGSWTNCDPPRTSCPAGTNMVNGHCEQSSICPAGSTKNARGECVQPTTCPSGTDKDANGNCVAQCPAGTTRDSSGRCNAGCPAGTTQDAAGRCQAQCPTGMKLDPTGTKCNFSGTCSDGSAVKADGSCGTANCPSGTTKNASGVCVGSCVAGQSMDASGKCSASCGSGLKPDPNTGQCVSDNQASGGTDCQAPPVCRGDQALCNIDYQAWAARCAADPGKGTADDLSQMYTKTGDSVGGVMGKYKDQLQSSPLVHAADNFFTVNVTGTCPQLTIPPAEFMGHNIWAGLDGNFFCNGTIETILGLASYVLLALASFQAFRIAFL